MASYNHSKFVGKAIESVLHQTHRNIEFLIGDDASSDNSVQIIEEYAKKDERIRFISFKVNRSEHIRNYFIKEAKGKYIAIINSDDEYELQKLERQVAILENDENIGLVFTRTKYIDEAGTPISESDPKYESYNSLDHTNRTRIEWLRYFIEGGRSFVHSSAMYRKELIGDVGYNQLLALMSDFDMWIRLTLKKNLYVLDEPLTKMRMMTGSRNMSANTIGNQNRVIFEFSHILQRLVAPDVIKDLELIFPKMQLPQENLSQSVREYIFYKYCIDNMWQPHHQFAINGMYDILTSDKKREEVETFFKIKLFGEFYKYTNKLRIVNFNYPEIAVKMNDVSEQILFEYDKPLVAEFKIPEQIIGDIHLSFPNIVGTVNIESIALRDNEGKTIQLFQNKSDLPKLINWNNCVDFTFDTDHVSLLCLKEGAQISFSFKPEANLVPTSIVIKLTASKAVRKKKFTDFVTLATMLIGKK